MALLARVILRVNERSVGHHSARWPRPSLANQRRARSSVGLWCPLLPRVQLDVGGRGRRRTPLVADVELWMRSERRRHAGVAQAINFDLQRHRLVGFGSWLCENRKDETALRKLILHMGN
jgi:hypothetical protein